MTRYDEFHRQVTDAPEDDEPRLAVAEHIRASEPARAEFIELQIADARRRRAARDYSRDVGK